MADAPVGSHSTNASRDVHPLLRQRMLNRTATFGEGAHPSAPPLRRRGSAFSDSRHSFRSSSDSLLRPSGQDEMDRLTKADEPSLWHSAPLVFAIVPAFAGLLFQNGGAVVMDILLLAFGSMFLNWCLRSPWEWYYAAQGVKYVEVAEAQDDDTIVEENEDSEGSGVNEAVAKPSTESKTPDQPQNATTETPSSTNAAHEAARHELQMNEILALVACFIGPVLGAYGLHAIRSYLTRPAEGLVSNFNLTIFVMAAEVRPVSHMIKLKQARMLHLQRLVRSDHENECRKTDIQDLSNRLADLEGRVTPGPGSEVEAVKVGATVRQSIQPQLDALNRAVRRYEKRQAAQSMQIEARFQDLDNRLRDALALAAAAARAGQRPGVISMAVSWSVSFVTYGLKMSWSIATSPFRAAAAMVSQVQAWVTKENRQPRKRVKTQSNGASTAVPTSRVQPRNGR
ncbi:hypothetical protein P280DRAFT_471006 [Massarina eburnea CBS 473.64]|uniref:Uncharacterized protein n=1 Tax=Massarina eburnea CBS 473.64 TaxID=1395130 RepID=A0A6A6RYF8_9PLEO|nr:hypothetical protein P280DRAFT_471006 [Massarina eburnea CBS 473.64]